MRSGRKIEKRYFRGGTKETLKCCSLQLNRHSSVRESVKVPIRIVKGISEIGDS